MKVWQRAALLLVTLLALAAFPSAALAAESTGAIGGAGFRMEQVYVNVPELDVFFYAEDQNGEPISPTMVQAAGVEVHLGGEPVDTGTIVQAADPLCYLLVVDNSAKLDADALTACKVGLLRLIRNKGENDQIALFTTAGGTACVLEATTDTDAAVAALRGITLAEGRSDLAKAAADVYQYVTSNYQSLAPRKALFAFTQSGELLGNLALAAALGGSAAEQLNMPVCAVVCCEKPELFEPLVSMAGGRIAAVRARDVGILLQEKQRRMAAALEIKTAIPESRYGEKLEVLTLTVPKLGSAVQCTATVYMGHRLARPAVEKVEVIGRSKLRLTFNQAVSNADRPACYRVTSNDIWNFPVAIREVHLSENGRTATLITREPMYEGNYGVALKNVTSRLTAANVSEARAETAFRIAVWPRDRAFYLARLRGPLLLAALLLAVLAGSNLYARRRERAAEQAAEAEHLLAAGHDAAALPRRWVTLFIKRRRTVAETRWSGVVESSLLLGGDEAQCDLCLDDERVAPQHCLLAVDGDALLVCPLDGQRVRVNSERIGGEHRLHNGDVIGLGHTTIRVVL